jgi:hypothetical protein
VSFAVRYSADAREDLKRLYAHPLDQSTTIEELDLAERAIDTIETAIGASGTRHSHTARPAAARSCVSC